MLRRIETLFGPKARGRGETLLQLIISDYLAYYGPTTPMRESWCVEGRWCVEGENDESPLRLALLFLPRLINNPSLHATLLLRVALQAPGFTLGFLRTVLIAKHSIDFQRNIKIGPGLLLPHPIGIGLGATLRIGSNVTILDNVTLGRKVTLGRNARVLERGSQLCPVIGDDVIIFTQSILVGGISVGDGAVVGAAAWVDQDVPPRSVRPGRAALFARSRPPREALPDRQSPS
jgi:serine O-acetyltransferase